MHDKKIIAAGRPLQEADKAMILLHGRGASPEDILSLVPYLAVEEHALLAPQATARSWYPYSFMAPVQQNEPWLSSAIGLLNGLIDDIIAAGIPAGRISLLGFSQGACLALEFAVRHPRRYGGIMAFTGGLIGDKLQERYEGDLHQTPVLIGSGDPDPHVPVQRVLESAAVLEKMNASVTKKIYPGMGHTIIAEEIKLANEQIRGI